MGDKTSKEQAKTEVKVGYKNCQASLDYKLEYYRLLQENERLRQINSLSKETIKNLGILLTSN